MRKLFIAAIGLVLLTVPASAQFAESNKSAQTATPAVGPQIGVTPLGAPTYIIEQKQQNDGVIPIGQIFNQALAPYIGELVNALVATGLGWLFWLLKTKLNINIDAEHRASITAAAQRQASSLLADGMVKIEGKTVTVDKGALAHAASVALAAAPDAAKRFGLTPENVAARIVDMIPQVPAGAQIVAAAHNGDDAAPPSPAVEKPA